MTRDELIANVQCSADDHPRGARRALHRTQAERILDQVLGVVLEEITPLLEREWCGNAVLGRIRKLKAEK